MDGIRVETHFAPAARSEPSELNRRLALLAGNPVTDTLLQTVGGLLAILDGNRQILAVNQSFLDSLGINDPDLVLGLRVGDAIRCVHAQDGPNGCGTTPFCATCGAAISLVVAQADGQPRERMCVAQVERDGAVQDLVLRVRACPIDLGGDRIVLLFMQDATDEQRRASLEKVFHHDMANLLQGLGAAADLVRAEPDGEERRVLLAQIGRLADHLAREVHLQRALHAEDPAGLPVSRQPLAVAAVMDELRRVFLNHPAARGRTLAVHSSGPEPEVRTDLWLLVRVLTNLVVNALEATRPGGRVEVVPEVGDDAVVFHVRNPATIPREIQPRIFQRNFTTKHESGHGLGTWSARFFTENLLGGSVAFTSTDRGGTDFTVSLPR